VGMDRLRMSLMDELASVTTTMYREMGMTYWLEKGEAEMKDLG